MTALYDEHRKERIDISGLSLYQCNKCHRYPIMEKVIFEDAPAYEKYIIYCPDCNKAHQCDSKYGVIESWNWCNEPAHKYDKYSAFVTTFYNALELLSRARDDGLIEGYLTDQEYKTLIEIRANTDSLYRTIRERNEGRY